MSPNIGALKAGARLNSESRRVSSGNYQPFNNLFSQNQTQADYLAPTNLFDKSPRMGGGVGAGAVPSQSQQLIVGQGLHQRQTSGQYDKQYSMYITSEADLLNDSMPANHSQRQIGVPPPGAAHRNNNEIFFNDLAILNHSATQDNMNSTQPNQDYI